MRAWGPPGPRTDPKAVWALVLAMASFVVCPLVAAIVAIVLAGAAARTIRDSGGMRTGSGLVTGARVVAWLNVALSVATIVLLVIFAPRFDDWFNDLTDRKPIEDVAVGECFNDASFDEDRVTDVFVVDCDEPHVWEAFEVTEVTGIDDYPGEATLATSGRSDCLVAFSDYVGTNWETSRYEIEVLVPDGGDWADGERYLVCALYVPGDDTVEGSGRGTRQ